MGENSNGKGSTNLGFSPESETDPSADGERKQVKMTLETEDEQVDKRFGLGPFKSEKLGKLLSNLYIFGLLAGSAACLSLAGLKSLSVHLNSLKIQFFLSDDDIADVQVGYSIGIVISSVVVGYLGSFSRISRPIVIGIATMLNGLCLMIPGFFYLAHPYDLDVDPSVQNPQLLLFLCSAAPQNVTKFPPPPEGDTLAYRVLVSSMTVSGFFMPIIAILSIVYIDNNTPRKARLGVFLGIFVVLFECATLSSMSVNGFFAQLPVDLEDTDLDPMDARFVGAWWLPLLLLGGFLIIIGYHLIQFPERLIPRTRQTQALASAARSFSGEPEQVTETADRAGSPPVVTSDVKSNNQQDGKTAEGGVRDGKDGSVTPSPLQLSVGAGLQRDGSVVFETLAFPRLNNTLRAMDFPAQLYRMLKNPIFVLILINTIFLSMPMTGPELFRPIYQMYEFGIPTDEVATAGISYSVTNLVGLIAGAYLSTRVHTLRGYAYVLLIGYGFSTILSPFYFLFGCENVKLQGYTGDFGTPATNESAKCNCLPMFTLPVCGDDGQNYLSPCYAGCEGGDGLTFTNCSLLATDTGSEAVSTLCKAGCGDEYIGYVAVYAVVTLFMQVTVVPRYLFILRMLEPRDRSFGVGLFIFIFYLFSIPAPKIFGHIFDEVGCVMTQAGICQLYERDSIRYLLSGIEVSVYGVHFFSALLIVLFLKMIESRVKRHNQMDVTLANTQL